MSALAKLNKQHEQTWINLQMRLNEIQFQYDTLFDEENVYTFLKNKAISVGSCPGYFVPSLLTTTAYILACNNTFIDVTTHKEPLNLYTVFIGYPGTGKGCSTIILTNPFTCSQTINMKSIFITTHSFLFVKSFKQTFLFLYRKIFCHPLRSK